MSGVFWGVRAGSRKPSYEGVSRPWRASIPDVGRTRRTPVADTLKGRGFSASVEECCSALVGLKAEQFPAWSIDELCFTRDEAADFCKLVRERLATPKLTRVFILRALVGTRKNEPKPRKILAS